MGGLFAVHPIGGMTFGVTDHHDADGLGFFIDTLENTVRKSTKIGSAVNAPRSKVIVERILRDGLKELLKLGFELGNETP